MKSNAFRRKTLLFFLPCFVFFLYALFTTSIHGSANLPLPYFGAQQGKEVNKRSQRILKTLQYISRGDLEQRQTKELNTLIPYGSEEHERVQYDNRAQNLSFQQHEITLLSTKIQRRIRIQQNPQDCRRAKKLLCTLKECGFGCQLHRLCLCLIASYATGRTAILDSRNFSYGVKWENVFEPISNSCIGVDGMSPVPWKGDSRTQELPLLIFPDPGSLNPIPEFFPVSIPSDIAQRLERVHGEPHIWWVGQFMRYLLRLQPQFHHDIRQHIKKLHIQPRTLGIHVRRTDKISTEASFHPLEEYIAHAEEYFGYLEITRRRIFIASEDPSVIEEARKKYGSRAGWEILADSQMARWGEDLEGRYSQGGLVAVLKDVFTLAECDFLVCTFSSNVCRLAYELLQSRRAVASHRATSLDDIYYYEGGNSLTQLSILSHVPNKDEEIGLLVGDKVRLAGNLRNGWSKGKNLRTNKVGVYPSYKARSVVTKVDFPKDKWWLNLSTPGPSLEV